MRKRILKIAIIFLIFFSFGFSQKIITNRTLRKYHHKRKRKHLSLEKRGSKKNNANGISRENGSLFNTKGDSASYSLVGKIRKEMEKLEYLKKLYLKQYNVLWHIDRKIDEMRANGGEVPSWLLEKAREERKNLDEINGNINELRRQIYEDLKKAEALGILKNKLIKNLYKEDEKRKISEF